MRERFESRVASIYAQKFPVFNNKDNNKMRHTEKQESVTYSQRKKAANRNYL